MAHEFYRFKLQGGALFYVPGDEREVVEEAYSSDKVV